MHLVVFQGLGPALLVPSPPSFSREEHGGILGNHSFPVSSVVLRNFGVWGGHGAHAAGSECIWEAGRLVKVVRMSVRTVDWLLFGHCDKAQ